MSVARSTLVWAQKHKVLSDHHVELVARSNLERRRSIHPATQHLLAERTHLCRCGRTCHLAGHGPLIRLVIAIRTVQSAAAERGHLADHLSGTDQTHHRCGAKCREIVVVNLIAETRVAALVRARHLRQVHARRVWKDEATPRDLNALLTVGRRVLICANEAAALRNEQRLAGRAVEYVFADLRE